MSDKAFGGARVIYVQRGIAKESKQSSQQDQGDRIARPYHATNGDLIDFWSTLPDLNAFHSRCLGVKAGCTVGLGFTVSGVKEDVVNAALSSVNALGQSFVEVISRVALDYETTGNGYLEVVRARAGSVGELYHVPARYVWRLPIGSEEAFLYEEGADVARFKAYRPKEAGENLMLHFAYPTSQSRYYGAPEWRGCVSDIELDYYAALYNQKFFVNSGIPDLAIIVEGGSLGKEDEQKVVEFFQNNFKGVDYAHRTLYIPVNDEGVKVRFERLAVDQKDRDGSFDKLRTRTRDNIVSAHGVPPRLVGIVAAGQLGGGGETTGQLKIFQETSIQPRQNLFALKLGPVVREMGLDGALAFTAMDTSVQEKASELYPKMVEAGILTVDEAREAQGYGPMETEGNPALEMVKGLRVIKSRWDRQEVA